MLRRTILTSGLRQLRASRGPTARFHSTLSNSHIGNVRKYVIGFSTLSLVGLYLSQQNKIDLDSNKDNSGEDIFTYNSEQLDIDHEAEILKRQSEEALPEIEADLASKEKSTISESEEETTPQPQGAYNPETGEINWDCPCLGGMAHGPCGEEFKEAFACFVYSEAEPKGIDCIKKFENMKTCFRKYPDIYEAELADDEDYEQQPQRQEPQEVSEIIVVETQDENNQPEIIEIVETTSPVQGTN